MNLGFLTTPGCDRLAVVLLHSIWQGIAVTAFAALGLRRFLF